MGEERSPNKVDKHVGARVRARRLEIAMSQETLAEILGITFQQVQKYEKGVNRITSGRLYDMTQALDVSLGYFFEGIGKPANSGSRKSDGDLTEAMAQSDTVELVRLFSSVKSKKLRRKVLDLVRAMTDDG